MDGLLKPLLFGLLLLIIILVASPFLGERENEKMETSEKEMSFKDSDNIDKDTISSHTQH